MTSEQENPSNEHTDGTAADGTPVIEDASEPASPPSEEVGEDDTELLESSARMFTGASPDSDDLEEDEDIPMSERAARITEADDISDVASLPDAVDGTPPPAVPPHHFDWERELSAHQVAVELKRIEAQVRELLENRDVKRKRKLSGSRRWRELEEDVLSWRFSGRFEEPALARLHRLIARRDYLFRRLRFLAGTRPIWNT